MHNGRNLFFNSFSVYDLDQDSKCGKRSYDCCPHQWINIKTEPNSSKALRDIDSNRNDEHNNDLSSVLGLRGGEYNLPSPLNSKPINLEREWFNLPMFHTPLFNSSLSDFFLSKTSAATMRKSANGHKYYVADEPRIKHSESGKTTGKICGKSRPLPIITKDPKVKIKFYSDTMVEPGHIGFTLQFQISNNLTKCRLEEFMCTEPQLCIPKAWQCNGQVECPDSSDEANCKAGCPGLVDSEHCDGRWHCANGEDELGCFGCDADQWWCGEGTECYKATRRCDGIPDCDNRADEVYCNCFNQTRCGPNSEFCYDSKTQRCDGILHCPNGNDEMDCGGHCRHMIPCSQGGICYTSAQRCDGTPQCGDGSDEASCTPQLCHPQHGAFLCANHRCIRDNWRCDQYDDCGDASDEEDCLRNSVIVAAAMGGLVCSLLLVIAVGCSCRLYALRVGLSRLSQPNHRGSRRSTPLSPLSQLEQHLLQREPPPSYSVAVNDPSAALFRGGRLSRQWRRQRRRPPTLPEGILPPLTVSTQGHRAPRPPLPYDTGPGIASSVRSFAGNCPFILIP
ncbi:hypothetical protein SK128_012193 [Halocaridina rubra]|uniref:Uncharacterized protein n=1 Tax=Halocaridina rubra TaxID=373956 RepID=A0AAN8WTJ2_HALRR